jgi:cell wall-associated NlpC family hydrolase
VHTDTPRGVRPSGRTGAAALAAISVLATGGVVLGAPGIAYTAPIAVDAFGVDTFINGGFINGATAAGSARPVAAVAAVGTFAGPVLPTHTGPARITHSHLSVDKAIVLSGQSIVLSGKLTYGTADKPFRSQPVRLQEGSGANWKTVGTALANPDGSVTFTVKPTKSTSYRLSYAGIRAYGASSSAAQVVAVKMPPPRPVVRTTTTSSSSSSGGSWAPAGVSQIGSNGRAASANGTAVVAAAAAQSGKPYVFGAAGPSSFDCSGLTMFVYAQFGVRLPHLADSQKNYGTPVSAADAAPGDLMIFLDGGYGYHVAIYAGGNTMYDAPHAGATVGRHTIWSTNITFRRLV